MMGKENNINNIFQKYQEEKISVKINVVAQCKTVEVSCKFEQLE